jgi:hypothetical protein
LEPQEASRIPTHFRSSIGVLIDPPAKSGKTCTVKTLQGLVGLEWTTVSRILLPSDTFVAVSGEVDKAVPSGRTTNPVLEALCDCAPYDAYMDLDFEGYWEWVEAA